MCDSIIAQADILKKDSEERIKQLDKIDAEIEEEMVKNKNKNLKIKLKFKEKN